MAASLSPINQSRITNHSLPSSLEDFHFVAVGVGDEGHFAAAGGEFFAPAGGPDFDAGFFEFVAVGDDVGYAEGGVHEVLGAGGGVFGRVAEFEKDIVAGELEECEAVALR